MKSQWVVKPRPRLHTNAEIKLLCFPYAGGGVSVYFPWKDKLTKQVELNIVQLPGRGTNHSQPPIDDMDELVALLLPKLSDLLQGPYVVYGHSMGSRVAFELVRQGIIRGYPAPLHFFASGSAAPKNRCFDHKIHDLPDDQFIDEIRNINGTPDDVLENRELMDLMLPTLRADFKIAENYECHAKFTIPTDVTVLSGRDDRLTLAQLARWGDFFQSSKTVMCEGGHFFIDSHSNQVLDIVNKTLLERVCVPSF